MLLLLTRVCLMLQLYWVLILARLMPPMKVERDWCAPTACAGWQGWGCPVSVSSQRPCGDLVPSSRWQVAPEGKRDCKRTWASAALARNRP